MCDGSPSAAPRVVTSVTGLPRDVYDRMARKRRGALIEPIYLCVVIAFTISATLLVLVDILGEPFGGTFALAFRAAAAGAMFVALVLLFVELRRGR